MILDGLGGWTSEGWIWRDVAKGVLGWWWRQVQWTEIGPEDVMREAFGFQDGEFSPRRRSKVSMELRSKSSLMEQANWESLPTCNVLYLALFLIPLAKWNGCEDVDNSDYRMLPMRSTCPQTKYLFDTEGTPILSEEVERLEVQF